MLRPGLALLMVVGVGCTEGEAPPLLGADFSAAVVDMAGSSIDLLDVDSAGQDLARQSCSTVCDCPAGTICNNGGCESSTLTILCCGAAGCTGSNVCQERSGAFSQCANPPDAGVAVDAGAGNACSMVSCLPGLGSQLFCSAVCGRAATCTNQGGMNRCTP